MKINLNNNNYNLPDFLIVGAQKSATTTLYKILNNNDSIFMPNIKEVNFFAYNRYDDKLNEYEKYNFGNNFKIITNYHEYFNLFSNVKSSQIIGESSVNYLFRYIQTIKKIKKYYQNQYKNIKIIISLRNPVDRAFSSWLMNVRDNRDKMSFEESIEYNFKNSSNNIPDTFKYLEYGLYYKAVKEYLDTFDNVHILLYDDIQIDFNNEINKIFKFLNIDCISGNINNENYNISGIPKIKMLHKIANSNSIIKKNIKYLLPNTLVNYLRNIINKNYFKPTMNNKVNIKLKNYYKEDIEKLNKLINVEHWIN